MVMVCAYTMPGRIRNHDYSGQKLQDEGFDKTQAAHINTDGFIKTAELVWDIVYIGVSV